MALLKCIIPERNEIHFIWVLPSFDVTPTNAVRATLTGVDIDITANQTQTNARVRTYDQYGNLTNVPTITTLNFSNATDATMGIRSSTGTMSLTRTGFGLYDVDGTRLWFAGAYTLTAPELATTTGGRFFQVRSLATATAIVIQPSTTAIAMGDLTANLRVVVQDRYGNPTAANPFPSEIEYNGMTMSSSGTLTLVPMALGTGFAKPGLLTQKGDYTVRINGTALPIFGTTRFRVIGREPERAEILGLPERLCNVEEDIEISIRFTDALGLPTDYYPTLIRYVVRRGGAEVQMGTLEFLGELSLGVARYRLRAPFVAGVYALQIPFPSIPEENVTGTLTMEVCGIPAALSVVGANISPGVNGSTSCIVAGQSLTGMVVRLLDAQGVPTFGVDALAATYQCQTAVSTGTLRLIPSGIRGIFTELAPPTVFTTAGTYSLMISTNGNIALTTVATFCVLPDVAAVGILSNVTASILSGGAQTPVLTVRDRWWNLTDYNGTLSYSGAASGTIALTRRSLGIYDAATTNFGVSGNYSLAAGMLEMRGVTTFVVLQPTIALSRTTLELNASVTSALTQNLTVTGTFDIAYQDMPNGSTITFNAPAGFLLSSPTCQTPSPQCVLNVSASGTERITVSFVRTPQTLAGAYSGTLTVTSNNNLNASLGLRCEAYSCGDAFPDPPKLTFLVLHTDVTGYFNYWRGESQNNARVRRFRGADNIREYMMESLDLSNLVNRNSGVNLRFSLDPVIFSTSAIVNVNGMNGALTTGIRDNWYYESQDDQDRYIFSGGEFDRIRDVVGSGTSILSRLREFVQADIVVLIGSVPFDWIDNSNPNTPVTRATVSAAGIASNIGITNFRNSFFLLDINRTYPKSLIFTHEAGHLCGGHHDFRDEFLYTGSSAGAILQFPANPPVRTATIDYGWYQGGNYRFNEVFVANGTNIELRDLANPSSVVEIGTIMAQFQPKVMNWANPAISITIPESGVFLPTGNTPPGYTLRNMTTRMNSDDNTPGIGGGRTVANFYREHITYIDASISGAISLTAGQSSVYRVNICGAVATRPFTYRWLLQQAGTQTFTQVGTGESFTLTMPDNREVRLRVEVSDAANHRVTAEAYIACATCPVPVIASVTEPQYRSGSSLTSVGISNLPPFEIPFCADGLHTTALAQQQRSGTLSNMTTPRTHQQSLQNEEIPFTVTLDTPYPNPAHEECTVSFSIPKATHVRLGLYDVLGNNVQTIADDDYSRGQKTFSVRVANLASGVYTLRLQTALGTTTVKNLTIIR